jgi:hypothetical protein
MQDLWHGQAEEWPRWRWTHLDSMEQEVMTPMTNKGKAMLKYMALPEPYNSYLSDDICEIEAEMLSLVPDVVSLNDAYQQGLRETRVAVEDGSIPEWLYDLLHSIKAAASLAMDDPQEWPNALRDIKGWADAAVAQFPAPANLPAPRPPEPIDPAFDAAFDEVYRR